MTELCDRTAATVPCAGPRGRLQRDSDAARDPSSGLASQSEIQHFRSVARLGAEVELPIAQANHFPARGARPDRLMALFQENLIDYARILDVRGQVGRLGYVGEQYVSIDWEHCNEVDNVSETAPMRDHLRGD